MKCHRAYNYDDETRAMMTVLPCICSFLYMIDHDNEEEDMITANKFTPLIYNHIMIHDINNRGQSDDDMMATSTTFSP